MKFSHKYDKNCKVRATSSHQRGQYIATNKHLPDIPSEQEIIENGLDVGGMQTLQMQKLEELTLYIIELQKQITDLKQEVTELKN